MPVGGLGKPPGGGCAGAPAAPIPVSPGNIAELDPATDAPRGPGFPSEPEPANSELGGLTTTEVAGAAVPVSLSALHAASSSNRANHTMPLFRIYTSRSASTEG
jgi:hypothetical protein